MIKPIPFFKCLADETRLRCVVLLQQRGELCVCELTQAMSISQPKLSRHLALLRSLGLLQDRRQGAWVYYRIHPDLPDWTLAVLQSLAQGVASEPCFSRDLERSIASSGCKPPASIQNPSLNQPREAT